MSLLRFFRKAAQSHSTSQATASVETDLQSDLQEPDAADPTSVTENR